MRKGDLPQGTQRAQRDRLRNLTGGNRAHGGFEQQRNEATKLTSLNGPGFGGFSGKEFFFENYEELTFFNLRGKSMPVTFLNFFRNIQSRFFMLSG